MWGLGRLDDEAHLFGQCVELGKQGFVLVGGQRFEGRTSSGGYEREHLPKDDARVAHERDHRIDVVSIVAGERGVDLHRELEFVGPVDGLHRLGKRAFPLPELVVDIRGRAVQREGDLSQAGLLEGGELFAGQVRPKRPESWPCAVRGRDRNESARPGRAASTGPRRKERRPACPSRGSG